MVINDYDAKKSDELTVKKNKDFVEVLKKCQSGFWLVRMYGGHKGLVPAVVLNKVTCPSCDKMTLLDSFKVKLQETDSFEMKDDDFDAKSLAQTDDEPLNSSTDSFNKPTPTEDNKLIFGYVK